VYVLNKDGADAKCLIDKQREIEYPNGIAVENVLKSQSNIF